MPRASRFTHGAFDHLNRAFRHMNLRHDFILSNIECKSYQIILEGLAYE